MFLRALLVLLLAAVALPSRAADFDLIIRNARIVDGTGAPWYRGELAIKGDTIMQIARRIEGTTARELDAKDRVVAPGFIDLHTHARRGIFEVPASANRGVLLPGLKADFVLFDPSTITDKATFEKPHQYAEGVSHVLVNGVFVVDEGKTTGARPGKVLRKNGGR